MLKEGLPLSISITGIDGAGKSTTTQTIAERMGGDHRVLSTAPSRPIYSVVNGEKTIHYKGFQSVIDRLHEAADRSGSPNLVGMVNGMNVLLGARVVEPSLIQEVKPDLILGARDFYIDPSVYSIIYQKHLAKKTMGERMDFLKSITGAPFRDVVFFLTVSPQEALARIERRIESEKAKDKSNTRDKWRHLHENEDMLLQLQREYYLALDELSKRSSAKIYEIDTDRMSQEDVACQIRGTISDLLSAKTSVSL